MNESPSTRRIVLARISVLVSGLFAGRNAVAVSLTPSATEGPYYPAPAMRPSDVDNDLVKINGLVQEAGGEVIYLKGAITNQDGSPRPGLRIEIWQCDLNGKYLHTRDHQNIKFDNGFQGFGHDITLQDGSYQFRTIKPTAYPGRTPHIHVKVCDGDKDLLTTQFYLKDHPDNKDDSIFRSMSSSQAESVSMVFTDGDEALVAKLNIIL